METGFYEREVTALEKLKHGAALIVQAQQCKQHCQNYLKKVQLKAFNTSDYTLEDIPEGFQRIEPTTIEGRIAKFENVQRQRFIEGCAKFNPYYEKPGDWTTQQSKRTLIIPIPEKEYPGYSFVGQIIGPRGETKDAINDESGAQISIRDPAIDSNIRSAMKLPKHIRIDAECIENSQKAAIILRRFLQPIPDEVNVHKQRQLRKLAVMAGYIDTDVLACKHCGGEDHESWACEDRFNSKNPWDTEKTIDAIDENMIASLLSLSTNISETDIDMFLNVNMDEIQSEMAKMIPEIIVPKFQSLIYQ
ncbi:hypothetical protein PCE1_002399 [Barthelona sp. PCE]